MARNCKVTKVTVATHYKVLIIILMWEQGSPHQNSIRFINCILYCIVFPCLMQWHSITNSKYSVRKKKYVAIYDLTEVIVKVSQSYWAFHDTHIFQSHETIIISGDGSVLFSYKFSLLASEQICLEPFVISMCKTIKPLSSSGTAHPSWNSIKTDLWKKKKEKKKMFKTLNKGHLANGRLAHCHLCIFVCLKPL